MSDSILLFKIQQIFTIVFISLFQDYLQITSIFLIIPKYRVLVHFISFYLFIYLCIHTLFIRSFILIIFDAWYSLGTILDTKTVKSEWQKGKSKIHQTLF